MRMRPARPAHAARTGHAAARSRLGGAAAAGAGGKNGHFLGQASRAATGARRPFPRAGTDQDFAVRRALFAMKFIDRHKAKNKPRGAIRQLSKKGRELFLGQSGTDIPQSKTLRAHYRRRRTGRFWSACAPAPLSHCCALLSTKACQEEKFGMRLARPMAYCRGLYAV